MYLQFDMTVYLRELSPFVHDRSKEVSLQLSKPSPCFKKHNAIFAHKVL